MSNKRPPMFLKEIVPEGEHHMKRIQHTLTTAEILALKASPVTLLAAPGVGKRYAVFAAFAYYTFNTTPFVMNGANALLICNDDTAASSLPMDGMITLAADSLQATGPVFGAFYSAAAKNVPLKLRQDGPAEITAGDGTLLVVVYYNIEDDH